MSNRCASAALVAAIAVAAIAGPATAEDFYKGKTITILAGFSPGGGFDANARALARHIGRHIPGNPRVIVQNMPGAGGLKALQYFNAVSPKDGTVMDIFNFGSIADSRLNPQRTKVDFRKFNWIGSISQDLTVCYGWHTLGVKTLADLQKRKIVHFGTTGAGSSTDLNQKILKNVFGVHLVQVPGYPGSSQVRMSIERGELDGDCGAWSSIPPEWIRDKKIDPVIRSSPATAPDLPAGVPYSVEIAPNDHLRQVMRLLLESNQLGRPFVASLAVPAERVRILREAFDATMKDPQFQAELKKLRLPFSPTAGKDALKIIDDIYAAPDSIVAAARKVSTE